MGAEKSEEDYKNHPKLIGGTIINRSNPRNCVRPLATDMPVLEPRSFSPIR